MVWGSGKQDGCQFIFPEFRQIKNQLGLVFWPNQPMGISEGLIASKIRVPLIKDLQEFHRFPEISNDCKRFSYIDE